MSETVTDRLLLLADHLACVEDFASIPVDKIMEMIGNSFDNIGCDSKLAYQIVLRILNRAVEERSLDDLQMALRLLALLAGVGDKAMSYGKMAESFKDIVQKRIPEYNYLKNKERLHQYYTDHEQEIYWDFSGKGCIYTVMTGGYDDVLPPLYRDSDLDYFLFTDACGFSADGWNIVTISNSDNLDARRFSRLPKILPYDYLKGYDFALYIDANIQITGDIRELISTYSTGESMLCLNHHVSTDIYEEAGLCIENGKGNAEQILSQIKEYETAGFPHGYGQTQNNFFVRNLKDERLKKVMQDWWKELNTFSERDQLSLTYCCWKNNYMYDSCPISLADNPYFRIHKHR